jgi:hypothetical protein
MAAYQDSTIFAMHLHYIALNSGDSAKIHVQVGQLVYKTTFRPQTIMVTEVTVKFIFFSLIFHGETRQSSVLQVIQMLGN